MKNKSVAIVITFSDFRDVEYFILKEILEEAGVKVKTVSTQKGTALGADGGEVKIDLQVLDVNPSEFDAVLFIGGPGMGKSLDNEDFHKLAKDTVSSGKILGAICIAPAMLAKAGILKGKKATVWSAPLQKESVKILKEEGAIVQENSVVIDGKIITAEGPLATRDFARAVKEQMV